MQSVKALPNLGRLTRGKAATLTSAAHFCDEYKESVSGKVLLVVKCE